MTDEVQTTTTDTQTAAVAATTTDAPAALAAPVAAETPAPAAEVQTVTESKSYADPSPAPAAAPLQQTFVVEDQTVTGAAADNLATLNVAAEVQPETPAPEPYLEPSPLQKLESAVEHAVDTGIEAVESMLHLGQHGHAAAQAADPEHVNPHDQEQEHALLIEQEQHAQQALDDLGHDEQFQQ